MGEERKRGDVVLPHAPTLLPITKAAVSIGLTPAALRQRFKRGTFPSEALHVDGGTTWVDLAVLAAYLRSKPAPPWAPKPAPEVEASEESTT